MDTNYDTILRYIKSIDSAEQIPAGERLAELYYISDNEALEYFCLKAELNVKRHMFNLPPRRYNALPNR